MKRKVTLFFLLMFASVQMYFAHHPVTHQVVGSTWIEVSGRAGRLVERQQQYFLATNRKIYRIRANSVHVWAKAVAVNWEEVPQPSGRGVWKVAYTRQGIPLIGAGGPVYPSTDGTEVIWRDPASGSLYESARVGDGLVPFASQLRVIQKVVWAPDGAAVAIQADGPEGSGIYVYDGDANASPVIVSFPVLDYGFTREETVLAALSHGVLVWQGHPNRQVPLMHPVYVDNGVASVWGVHGKETLFWQEGRVRPRPRPDVNFIGAAQFSENGSTVAVLARSASGHSELYLDGTDGQLSLRLPYDVPTADLRLEGFVGNRWVLASVLNGPHRGTYAWWVNPR
jgi:hypothetical protein